MKPGFREGFQGVHMHRPELSLCGASL
jgi:hypothetical protein